MLVPMATPISSLVKNKNSGRDPFNQNSNRSDREKRTTSKGGPVFSKLFRLDRTDPLSLGPKFPEILVEWIAPSIFTARGDLSLSSSLGPRVPELKWRYGCAWVGIEVV